MVYNGKGTTMRYVRLIAVCDEYDNKPGLALKGAPVNVEGFMADRDGTLVAHDLIEHVNGRGFIGTVWDELEALGAIWQARGRHADLRRDRVGGMYTPAQNLASDLVRMFPEWHSDPVPPKRHRTKATRAHLYDEDFLEIIEHARHEIPREYDDGDSDDVERYLTEALHRMRTGYRKADRKYGDGWNSNTLYWRIAGAVKGASIEFEGQEFTLAYDANRAYVQDTYDRE